MATNQKKGSEKERAVLVTTAHRGVFFGYAEETSGNSIKLRRCRSVVYWTTDMRGFMGLAAIGPNNGCRIGPPADGDVRDVTGVFEVTPEAVEKWETGYWS